MNKRAVIPYLYALATIAATFLVGQLILWLGLSNTDLWASILFILMNLLPMLMAFVFLKAAGEASGILSLLKGAFPVREKWYAYAAALGVPVVYYGVSIVLGNVTFTGAALGAAAAYFPWTLLQGGLEEVGWRWYLQPRQNVKNSYLLKLLVLSVIWFVWHFPIYRLPWVTTASSNCLIFYLLILGNTFTLGAVRELSRGSIPCILAHMLVDTGAVLLLVDSTLSKIIALVAVEILISVVVVQVFRKKGFTSFSK